jgi:hypothetical protein
MEALNAILDVIIVGIWISSVTYLLGLLIMGCFGRWKQNRERAHKQYRFMFHNDNGDPFGVALTLKKEEEEEEDDGKK